MSDGRQPVLVVGAVLAGVTGVVGALRDRLGGRRVVERLDPGETPAAVVFVVSAAAPMIESDVDLLDTAAAHTDAVVAVVSKIDVHRRWRQVLEANRLLLAGRATRCADLTWVGVAADPQVGQATLDPLIDALLAALAGEGRVQRNPLRAGNSQLTSRAVSALTVRSQIQQSRIQLVSHARMMCAALRAELRHDAAGVSRSGVDAFGCEAIRRSAQAAAEFDAMLTRRLTHLAGGVGLPAVDTAAPACPALESYLPRFAVPRSENRLGVLLSAGFGLGVTVTVGRALADAAPGWTPAVTVGTLVAGIALTGWVIRTRGLLAQRAALDRWVTEVTVGLRTAMEETVVTQLLAAEFALAAAGAAGELAAVRRFRDSA